MQNKRAAFVRMANTPAFRLWVAMETGRLAVLESTITIPPEQLRVETRVGGRWVETAAEDLT